LSFHREKQSVTADELLQAFAGGLEIHLSCCTITGVLDINRLFDTGQNFNTDKLDLAEMPKCKTITFHQPVVFDKCLFEENTVFTAPWAEPDSISVVFEKDVIFNSSHFMGQARFRNAVFQGVASFDGCTFEGVATFKNATISLDAKFRTTVFKGYSLFGNARFESSARFANTHFVKGANFAETKFLGQTDFGGVYSSSRAIPVYDSIFFARRRYGDDESFWRFVKQTTLDAGYYQLAGECFYNERCASLRRKLHGIGYENLSTPRRILRLLAGLRLLPELVFGKLLFGYGERPVRVLVAAVMLILVCALLYAKKGMLIYAGTAQKHSFIQGLYFSTVTFTTLGYGDLHPAREGFCRFLAMFEAVSGGCLIALFVVCLAKRFSRG